jgi:hypothetical protein
MPLTNEEIIKRYQENNPDLTGDVTQNASGQEVSQFNQGNEIIPDYAPQSPSAGPASKSEENWLSTVNLGTYKFTLYLTSVDVYNDPSKLINHSDNNSSAATIIAESGVTGGYGIDNVVMTGTVIGAISSGGIPTTNMQFDLHEPLGFKLLDRILQFKKVYNFSGMHGASLIMKLEFLGRDVASDNVVRYPGVFFFKLNIQNITASVSPAGTRYNIITAVGFNRAVHSGATTIDFSLKGIRTVEDLVTNLAAEYNRYTDEHERKDVDDPKNSELRPKISFEFDFSAIEVGLDGMAWSPSIDPTASEAAGFDPKNIEGTRIPIAPGTDIPEFVIAEIEKNVSDWKRYFEKEHNDPSQLVPVIKIEAVETKFNEIDPQTRRNRVDIKYIIHVERVSIQGTSPKENDNQIAASASRFQNMLENNQITKKYNYLFSGQNTEVLDFTLSFNTLFFAARVPMSGYGYSAEWGESTSTYVEPRLNSSNIGAMGQAAPPQSKVGGGIESMYLEDIELSDKVYDPSGAYSYIPRAEYSQNTDGQTGDKQDFILSRAQELSRRQAGNESIEIKIKGDPFWIGVPGVIYGQNDKNTTLNASAGAGVDNLTNYTYNGNKNIIFLTYNPDDSIAYPQEKGYTFDRRMDMVSSGIFSVHTVTSRFQNGEFTQQIEALRDPTVSTFMLANELENY